MKTIKYMEEPNVWISLHTAGESNLITAIYQLRRIGFDDKDIQNLLILFLLQTKEDSK